MTETKYILFVASHEFFQTQEDFIAAVNIGHSEIVTYEFVAPSSLDKNLVRLIANGILFDNDWCSDGIYTELRSELPVADLRPPEPVFDNEAAARELFILGAIARRFKLEPNIFIEWDWLRRAYNNNDNSNFWDNSESMQNRLRNETCSSTPDVNDIVRSKTTFDSVVARFRAMPTDELVYRYTTRDFMGPFIRPEL